MKLNITLLIPLLLVISTLFASTLLYLKHDHEANISIRNDALLDMNLDITRLQNILYNLLTERADNIEEARLNLSVTAMDPSIQTLLLANNDGIVIMANRYIWEGYLASEISNYDANRAKQVIQHNKPDTFFYDDNDSMLAGYYPVVLQLESERGLPIKRMGVLYTEISIANRLAYAKNKAAIESLILGGAMLAITIIVAILLHFMISVRLQRLTSATGQLASGDLDASVSMGGNDELTVVGNAFDDMATMIRLDIRRRERAEHELQDLNKTLEHRVEERTRELEFKKQQLLDSQALAHHANKMGALGEMASGIAHEINSPLQSISLLTYRLKKNAVNADHADIETMTDKIDRAVHQITSIVDSLRKMSRDSSSDPFENVIVDDIIKDATEITSERYKLKGIDFTIDCHEECEKISLNCQRLQISQILINLLNNAYDAVQEVNDKWITLDVFDIDNCIVIAITDSGSGIELKNQGQIFLPMFTTKEIGQGTGLGLSISSEIAQNHGGILQLDTESEHTRFVLTLPKSGIKHNIETDKAI